MTKIYVKMFNDLGSLIGEFNAEGENATTAFRRVLRDQDVIIDDGDRFEIAVEEE